MSFVDIKSNKRCFVTRVYDDLCEDILRWLPIEEKIILSGVSKQFKRCLQSVCLRQEVMKLDLELENDRNNLKIFMKHLSDIRLSEETKLKKFEKILMTFPNIKEIIFGKNTKLYMIEDLLLRPIIKHCHRLESIAFSPFNCSTKLVEDFAEHFGPNLKKVEFRDKIYMIQTLIEKSPGLQTIKFLNFKNLFNKNKKLLARNVQKLKVFGVQDIEMLDEFVDSNRVLTHLEIGFSFANSSLTSEAFTILSKLSSLRILKISLIDCNQFDEKIAESVESIAKNCNRLKSFGLEVEFRKSFDTHLCFERFKHLPISLTRLSLNSHDSSTPNPIPNQTLDSNCLMSLANLTHLELLSDQIDDRFFADIHTKVPKLKYLMIGFARKKISDHCFNELVKLEQLETLVIKCLDRANLESLTDSGLQRVIDECKFLRVLGIFNKMKISETTVDKIIDKAIENPLIYYNYYLRDIENWVNLAEKLGNRCPNNVFVTGSGHVFAKNNLI